MRRLFFFLILLCTGIGVSGVYSQEVDSSENEYVDSTLQVSLLTCSPGQAVYELYGHTAIRVKNERHRWDYVFNYGVFDFHQPHFVGRFVLGECDYIVFPYRFDIFREEYATRGSSITEQVLNLTPQEATSLMQALLENCDASKRVYRYNIFRNNCTTKARDIIEEHIQGYVIYPMQRQHHTFRTLLHEYTAGHAWAEAGNDLLLGEDVDTLINERDEMFAPLYLMNYFDGAMIDRGLGRYDSLVRVRRVLLEENQVRQQLAAEEEPSFPISPSVLGWGLLIVGVVTGVWEVRRRHALWGVDAVLMTFQGVAGLLLAFMALFSSHPGVASNWQIWVLNPLALLFVVAVVKAERRKRPCLYHPVAGLLLALFLILYVWLPQDFSSLTMPLALLLLSRALTHILIDRRRS